MTTKLFVGGLAYATNEKELTEAFASYGAVEGVKIITDRESGRSKGFGFVEMSDESAANDAIEAMNGKDFGGRTIIVNVAHPEGHKKPQADRSRRAW